MASRSLIAALRAHLRDSARADPDNIRAARGPSIRLALLRLEVLLPPALRALRASGLVLLPDRAASADLAQDRVLQRRRLKQAVHSALLRAVAAEDNSSIPRRRKAR